MINPNIKIAKSSGIDLPILYVYLAGRIAGNCIDKCTSWRHQIINHYKNYKPIFKNDNNTCVVEYESYPISFLCPLNSGEANSVDKQGLTSSIPSNLIYDKDILSVERADVIVANMDDFFEVDIDRQLTLSEKIINMFSKEHQAKFYKASFLKLKEKIANRRENLGTISEVAIALYLHKPIILIVPETRKVIFEKHPFMKRASVIVTSTNQLLEEKWLQILYKSVAGATY